jgi:hypothetical protein
VAPYRVVHANMGLALAIVEVVELWSQEHILGMSGEVGVLKGVEVFNML